MKTIFALLVIISTFVYDIHSQETVPYFPDSPEKNETIAILPGHGPMQSSVYGTRFFGHCLSTSPSIFSKGYLTSSAPVAVFGPTNDPFLYNAMEFDGNGILYCISNGLGRPLRKLDTLTGITDSLGYMTGFHNTNEHVDGMAYNPQNKLMYLMSFDATLSYIGNIHSLNTETRVVTYIGNTNFILHDIAINNEGECYGIAAANQLIKINLTNANSTIIGNTGVNCANYIQSICFDRETDSLWFSVRNAVTGLYELRTINTATGLSTFVGEYTPQIGQIVGLSIPFPKTISVSNISLGTPDKFILSQNYPNPFNPVTKINFSVPQSSKVSIVIYDILGNEIEVLVNEFLNAGVYETEFNSRSIAGRSELSSGIYFYILTAGKFTETKKMTLLK